MVKELYSLLRVNYIVLSRKNNSINGMVVVT